MTTGDLIVKVLVTPYPWMLLMVLWAGLIILRFQRAERREIQAMDEQQVQTRLRVVTGNVENVVYAAERFPLGQVDHEPTGGAA